MCGIAGQVSFDQSPVSEMLMKNMGELLAHRGRDHMGIYAYNNIGLVHRRLSIIDMSEQGSQPMFSSNKNLCIIFNGEIFNYIELKTELQKMGYEFKSESDTEVMLNCYLEYGMDSLNKIEGMFAFALVDFSKSMMYLVRDRMGIKPLYYYNSGKALSFGSEIKVLIKSGICEPGIDPAGLKDYIYTQLYIGDKTLFKNVKTLEPGTYMSIDYSSGLVQHHVYWDVPDDELNITYDEAIECLKHEIKNAVKLWSRADVPIASHISGGLDSSLVATIASGYINKSLQDKLYTFSSVFPQAEFKDEREYSDAVADKIESEHHRVILHEDEIIEAHKELLYTLDMPIAGYSAPYQVLSRIVRETSRVVLTGHGGDELFCGYPKYIAAFMAKELNDGSHNGSGSLKLDYLKYLKGFEKQAKNIISKSLFGGEKDIIESLYFRSEHLWEFVHPDIQREAKDYDVAETLLGIYSRRRTGYLKRLLYLDQKTLLPGLLHVEDRTAMRENLESRTPLLDRRIVELAARMPEQYLLRDGLKGMIRRVANDFLPQKVAGNPSKSGTMYPAAELFENKMRDSVQHTVKELDNFSVFTKSAAEILGAREELVNKRILWGIWSIASWLKSYF